MRIQILKTTKQYRQGQILQVTEEVGRALVRKGIAVHQKMMVQEDYRVG